MKKVLNIKMTYLKLLLVSFLFSFALVFTLMHFGKFYYGENQESELLSDDGEIKIYNYTTLRAGHIMYLRLVTPWESEIYFSTYSLSYPHKRWEVRDLDNSLGDFYKYSNRLKYYFQATFKEINYVLIIWVLTSGMILFFIKYKFKII